jgi:hypothetical protein
MPRSISQGPVKYDQKDELSRAGRKIAALKKHIRFLEEVLEERTRPSSYVRALSEGDDHDKASVGVHLDKITEWKENFGLLHKAYQDSVEEVCLTHYYSTEMALCTMMYMYVLVYISMKLYLQVQAASPGS